MEKCRKEKRNAHDYRFTVDAVEWSRMQKRSGKRRRKKRFCFFDFFPSFCSMLTQRSCTHVPIGQDPELWIVCVLSACSRIRFVSLPHIRFSFSRGIITLLRKYTERTLAHTLVSVPAIRVEGKRENRVEASAYWKWNHRSVKRKYHYFIIDWIDYYCYFYCHLYSSKLYLRMRAN